MDYIGILKDSYKIAIRNRYLWIFAILAGGIGGGNFSYSMPSSTSTTDAEQWKRFVDNFNVDQFITQYWGVIIAIIGLFVVFGLFWFILSVISQGALLGSVRAISEKQKSNFKLGFLFGWHNFWKVFATSLVSGLVILFSLIVLVVPIILFVVSKIYILAIIYGILVFLIDLILWIYISLMFPYILRMVILGEKGVWKAYAESWQFLCRHWKDIAVMYLLSIAVGIVIGIGFILVLLLVIALLGAIGFAIYLASKFVFVIYVSIFGLALIVAFFIVTGAISAFNSSILTLTYLNLIKKA